MLYFLLYWQAKFWHSQNTESIGSLWLKLLEFYCLGFDHAVNIISVRQQKVLPRADRKWNSKRLAVEGEKKISIFKNKVQNYMII
jgi:hypothetical protein